MSVEHRSACRIRSAETFMDLIFRHFAIILIAVVLINVAVARARIPRLVAAGRTDAAQAEKFVWLTAAWFIGTFALDEVLTITSGASSPTCFIPASHPNGTWQYLAWTIWIGWVLGVTGWIWFGRGAERVATFGPLFAKRFEAGQSYKTSTIRLVTLLWCVGIIVLPLLTPASHSSTRTCP